MSAAGDKPSRCASPAPGLFDQETAYIASAITLHDEYDSDADTLITRPAAAYTSSPYVFERQPTFPAPAELTPPPSPLQKVMMPPQSTTTPEPTPANVRWLPTLARATSVLGGAAAGLRSKEGSPTRSPQLDAQDASPTASRVSVASSGRRSPNHKSKGSFADLFQIQGGSAPLNLGLISSSPKRETPPRLNLGHRSCQSESMTGAATTETPTRPGHLRRNSTLHAAASFLGFAPQRSSTPSSRRQSPQRVNLDDSIMRIDFEDAVFPDDDNGIPKEKVLSVVLANGKRVLDRVQSAYLDKAVQLENERRARAQDQEALAEARMRADQFKEQLDAMATQMQEKESEIEGLHDELDEMDRRARSIRLLDPASRDSFDDVEVDRERFFSLGPSVDDSSESGGEDGESVFERPGSRSTAPTEADAAHVNGRGSTANAQRGSVALRDAAPFLKPGPDLERENRELKRRIAELEETVNGCLGLVDL